MTTRSGKRKASSASKSAKRAPGRTARAKARPQAAQKPPEKKAQRPPPKSATRKAGATPAPLPKSVPAKPAPSRAGATKSVAERRALEAKRRPGPKSKPKMRRKEFEGFRQTLVERQRELLHTYSVSKGDSRAHPDSGTEDYIDYAVSSYAKEFLLSLSEMDRKQLLLVDEALARMVRAEYGCCLQCGEEIARKRLEVAPWVRYCIRCQDLEEQGLLPEHPGRLDADGAEEEEGEEPPAREYDAELVTEGPEDLEEEPLGAEEDDSEEADEN